MPARQLRHVSKGVVPAGACLAQQVNFGPLRPLVLKIQINQKNVYNSKNTYKNYFLKRDKQIENVIKNFFNIQMVVSLKHLLFIP